MPALPSPRLSSAAVPSASSSGRPRSATKRSSSGRRKNSAQEAVPPSGSQLGRGGEKPLYIAYMRVSKDDDVTGSHTFETQEKRIKECLDSRCGEGKYLLEMYKDDGLSGSLGLRATGVQRKVRPTLRLIADRIQTGECAGLVVYDQKRLFRDIQGLTNFINDVLRPSGVSLISATEKLDIWTGDGRMSIYFNGIVDERVREDIVKRNKDAAATRAEEGYVIGQAGLGWKWDEKYATSSRRRNVVPVEGEKHWVLHIKERYLSGWNAYRIVEELNDLQVPTPLEREIWKHKAQKREAKLGRKPRWTASTIYYILSNPLHAGLVRTPTGEMVEGRHWEHRFWDREVLDQIEQTHDLRIRHFKGATGQKHAPHLLIGFIRCARCSNRLYMSSTSATTNEYRSYKCATGRNEGRHTCPNVVARAEWVEQAVVEEISRIAQEPEMHRLIEEELAQATEKQDVALHEERRLLKGKVAQLQEQFEQWAQAFSRQVMNEKQFMAFSQKMQSDEEEATVRLEQVERDLEARQQREVWMASVRDALLDFPQAWGGLDNDEKRQLLQLLLEEPLQVDRQNRDIHLKMKMHLLPLIERIIPYKSRQGTYRTRIKGMKRLSKRQMRLLFYAGQGKKPPEVAQLLGCSVQSLYSVKYTICRNLQGISWAEAIEMTRDVVQANLSQLGLREDRAAASTCGKQNQVDEATPGPKVFLSPVLMEVFRLFAEGAKTVEVAERLRISAVTVQGRRQRILRLFGTNSMFEAVQMAKGQKILG